MNRQEAMATAMVKPTYAELKRHATTSRNKTLRQLAKHNDAPVVMAGPLTLAHSLKRIMPNYRQAGPLRLGILSRDPTTAIDSGRWYQTLTTILSGLAGIDLVIWTGDGDSERTSTLQNHAPEMPSAKRFVSTVTLPLLPDDRDVWFLAGPLSPELLNENALPRLVGAGCALLHVAPSKLLAYLTAALYRVSGMEAVILNDDSPFKIPGDFQTNLHWGSAVVYVPSGTYTPTEAGYESHVESVRGSLSMTVIDVMKKKTKDLYTPGQALPDGTYHLLGGTVLDINEDIAFCGKETLSVDEDSRAYYLELRANLLDLSDDVDRFIWACLMKSLFVSHS